MKYTGSSFEQHGSTSVHYIKLTCRTHCCRTLTKQISALNAPTIKNKFQVKKSPSETPAEASNKCSIFAPFSYSFSKPLWTVARKRMLAKTSLSGLCSDTNWSCFYVLISQWILVGNWEHTEKAKQLSSAAGVELKSEWPTGQSTQDCGLINRSKRHRQRYRVCKKDPGEDREKQIQFLWCSKYVQNSTSAFYSPHHRSTARVTTCP